MSLSFVYIASGLCTIVSGNLTVLRTLITCSILIMVSNVCREVNEVITRSILIMVSNVCREVDEVGEEGLIRRRRA